MYMYMYKCVHFTCIYYMYLQVREHADPLSHSNTPIGTPSGSTENLLNL